MVSVSDLHSRIHTDMCLHDMGVMCIDRTNVQRLLLSSSVATQAKQGFMEHDAPGS